MHLASLAELLTSESMSDGLFKEMCIYWSVFIILSTGLPTPAALVDLSVLTGTAPLHLPSADPRASHRQRGGIPLLVKYSCEYFPLRA